MKYLFYQKEDRYKRFSLFSKKTQIRLRKASRGYPQWFCSKLSEYQKKK